MKAIENSILKFMEGKNKFIIPVYQRSYDWKKENCIQLLEDLKALTRVDKDIKASHFFGAIVFIGESDGRTENRTIIDGQQRITTISLLLLALKNYIKQNTQLKININAKEIHDVYLADPYSETEKKLKLRLIKGDDEAYNNLINDLKPNENTNITANYNYFYNEISKMSPEEIDALYDAIAKLDIVSVSLFRHDGDNPQLIFESLNSTGMDLQEADKIRNFILMDAESLKQESFYNKYWKPIEEAVYKDDINKFIRYYLAVKLRRLPTEAKLYQEFKRYFKSCGLPSEEILNDILVFAEYYESILNPKKYKTSYSDVLARINKLDVKTCIPFIMDLLNAQKNGLITDKELGTSLEIIENYIVRREICGLPTNALNKVFVQLGSDIEKDMGKDISLSYFDALKMELLKRSGKSRYPSDREFEEKFMVYDLYNSKAAIKKYILERLENFGNKERVAVEDLIDSGKMTVEHIMPQTMTPEWKEMLGENWEFVFDKYLHLIGNLTLSAYNSEYSNNDYRTKKTLPDKGFNYSKLYLNEYIKKQDNWTEAEINDRAKTLFDEKAKHIWWMPKSDYLTGNICREEWFNWDDDADVTNKKIKQIYLIDDLIDIKSNNITDAYKLIHEKLYDTYPTIYHNCDLPWISNNPDNLREAYKISDDLFIETNKSSQDKMKTIRTMAELSQLDPEDIRYLILEKSKV